MIFFQVQILTKLSLKENRISLCEVQTLSTFAATDSILWRNYEYEWQHSTVDSIILLCYHTIMGFILSLEL